MHRVTIPMNENTTSESERKHVKGSNRQLKIRRSWAILYVENDDRLKYFLVTANKTFKLKHVAKRADLPKGVDYNMKLFTVKSSLKKNEIIKITITPMSTKTGLSLDGNQSKKQQNIVRERSRISFPNHDLCFIFEVLPDAAVHPNLNPIRNEYRIVSLLGQGGFGKVYKVVSIETEDFCAVKTELVQGKIDLEDEYLFISQMEHRGIIHSIDYIATVRNEKYLIMEFARGGTLNQRINEKKGLREQLARHIMKQVFSAVYYLHNVKDIVHRDIGPVNIVCMSHREYCVVKLIDFGLSSPSDSMEMRRCVGRRHFMPPEMLQKHVAALTTGGSPAAIVHATKFTLFTKGVDVWSLGVTLFVTLTGEPPVRYQGNIQLFLQKILAYDINTGTPKYEYLSADVKKLINRCLTIKESERPSVATVMKNKWLFAS